MAAERLRIAGPRQQGRQGPIRAWGGQIQVGVCFKGESTAQATVLAVSASSNGPFVDSSKSNKCTVASCGGTNLEWSIVTDIISYIISYHHKIQQNRKRNHGRRCSSDLHRLHPLRDRRTQRDVADVAGVTEVTIRNRYRGLAEELDIEIIL